MKTLILRLMVVVVLMTVLTSCATTSKVDQTPKRFFWPSEPEQPRIEWIATYFGELDIKEQGFMSAIVGSDSSVQLVALFLWPVMAKDVLSCPIRGWGRHSCLISINMKPFH